MEVVFMMKEALFSPELEEFKYSLGQGVAVYPWQDHSLGIYLDVPEGLT